ncbi:MAG: hypothetical protein GKR87_05535 [Kiritimatiellae bacterium]|nr:hypothetical protein [Kiritimatiellia bacterium]
MDKIKVLDVLVMKNVLQRFLKQETHSIIQFAKYGVCGLLATGVDILIFYILAWRVLPALSPDDPLVRLLGLQVVEIREQIRATNYICGKIVAFIFSNLTAYLTNAFWVFESGRRKRYKEVPLFYIVSIVSFFMGTLLGWMMIRMFSISTTVAYIVAGIIAVMINYIARKRLIFKG